MYFEDIQYCFSTDYFIDCWLHLHSKACINWTQDFLAQTRVWCNYFNVVFLLGAGGLLISSDCFIYIFTSWIVFKLISVHWTSIPNTGAILTLSNLRRHMITASKAVFYVCHRTASKTVFYICHGCYIHRIITYLTTDSIVVQWQG